MSEVMTLEEAIKWGIKNPRKLFLIDGSGALLSAFLLGVVLVEFEYVFGIPRPTLYLLASFPCLFAIYDFYNYGKQDPKIKVFLKGIAIMNLMYCFLSIGLAIYHFKELTHYGWIYIILEIMIVITLANLEYRVSTRLNF